MDKLIDISNLSRILNLVDNQNKKTRNHTIRFWEKKFKQIKPKLINKRRYYSSRQVEVIKLIKFLIKDKGMTIKGVQNLLNVTTNKLDVNNSDSLKTIYLKERFKEKSNKILQKINKIKKYGKKNSH